MANYQILVDALLNTKGLQAQLTKLGKGTKLPISATGVQDVNKQMGKTQKEIAKTKSVWNSMKTSFKERIGFMGVTVGLVAMMNGAKSAVNQVFELDKALTEMKKVSDLNGASLKQFTDDAFEAGKATAKTGTEMVDAAT